jgi:hypothetical protein
MGGESWPRLSARFVPYRFLRGLNVLRITLGGWEVTDSGKRVSVPSSPLA